MTLLRVQKENVDLTHVRKTLGLLESALGQSDLLPLLDQALARARQA